MRAVLRSSLFGILSLFLLGSPLAHASILVTAEAPGVQSSQVAGVVTEDFNGIAAGFHANLASAIGNYSGGLAVVNPDDFGGANATKYMAVGVQSGTNQVTLDLGQDRAYFGLFYSAGDAQNSLQFYDGATLIATFNTSDVITFVGGNPAYFGNPNNGLDGNEPFAYLNFFSTGGTVFDKVVFGNQFLSSGFESDNHSVLTQPVTIPSGTPIGTIGNVPEPATIVLLLAGCLGGATLRRRQVRR